MKTLKLLCRIAFAAVLVLGITSVSAAPVFYNSEVAFLGAAGGGLGFEGYENAPGNTSDTYTFPGFSVSETNGANILTNVAINNFFSAPVVEGTNAIWYDDNNGSLSNFFAFSGNVNAFGTWVTTSQASTVTISGGSFNTSLILAANQPQFFGVIDTMVADFAPITFDASGGPEVGFDATYFGSAAVPAPLTLLLLGTGLLGLGAVRCRRGVEST